MRDDLFSRAAPDERVQFGERWCLVHAQGSIAFPLYPNVHAVRPTVIRRLEYFHHPMMPPGNARTVSTKHATPCSATVRNQPNLPVRHIGPCRASRRSRHAYLYTAPLTSPGGGASQLQGQPTYEQERHPYTAETAVLSRSGSRSGHSPTDADTSYQQPLDRENSFVRRPCNEG